MRIWIVLLLTAASLCSACREGPSSDTARAAPAKAPAVMGRGAAQAGAGPGPAAAAGAGQDAAAAELVMCREHGVPEAVCTKCNPSLIPVFKAKGDWCEEHGFPESFCPICHPDRGGKPAHDITGAADTGPADGTKVMFKSFETAERAGIRTVAAVEGQGGATLTVPARIVYDGSKTARVNARSDGVVHSVRADIGAKVRRGTPLAVIESAGVGADQSRLQAARSRAQVAEANLSRMQKLHVEGIVPEVDVLAARKEADEARADIDAARTSLGMIGGTKEGSSRYTLSSPIDGVVTSRNVTIGRMVDTEETLFEIVDTSTVWAELDIPEADVAGIASDQRVALTVDGLGDREFSGTLTYIAPEIDSHTRTAKGRVLLKNADGALRANMFARARLASGANRVSVLVPREAVQKARGAKVVFVRLSEQVYETRRITTGPALGDMVAVSGRIKAGDRVVTDGSFLLKTETLKESIGAGCCDVEPGK